MQKVSSFCAKYRRMLRRFGCYGLLVTVVFGCSRGSDSAPAVAPPMPPAYHCGSDGFLSSELFGAYQAHLQWSAADLECEGMPRPDGEGARLRFAGKLDGRQIAFIIALPELRRGVPGKELATTVTLIEEGSGRFFSTADQNTCWTDIVELENIDASDASYRIAGRLYCVSPLMQVNGESDVLIRDLQFRGQLDWSGS
ncbi:MAG: hypothetical protein OEV69_15120 [Gammaproteobacteria bacterium]|nr:hypothetical protein [Gammaproteobacteria bacterium]